MPIEPYEYKWRDRILLLVGWGTIFFTAVANWASDGLPIEITEPYSQSHWNIVRTYLYTILPFVILLVPVLIFLAAYAIPSFSLQKIIIRFQSQEIFWVVVFAFNLGLVSLISS